MSIQGKMNIQRKVSMRSVLAFLSIIIINLPIIAIVSRVNFSSNSNWKHFKQYLLPDAVSNTLLLVIITLLLSGTIGVLLATAVALFDFPLKRFFEWVLYIPITIPPYIAAYVYAYRRNSAIMQRLGHIASASMAGYYEYTRCSFYLFYHTVPLHLWSSEIFFGESLWKLY
ncbi:MAG: binding-protein-dependent transport system inner rane component [Clostridia bacterium]|nr:binding-protein-dependent transport system inner rane component [Clostridia bacterium]